MKQKHPGRAIYGRVPKKKRIQETTIPKSFEFLKSTDSGWNENLQLPISANSTSTSWMRATAFQTSAWAGRIGEQEQWGKNSGIINY